MLDDDGGRTRLPVTAELTSNRWIKIGSDDFRQVLSCPRPDVGPPVTARWVETAQAAPACSRRETTDG
jgi:hypothetical protein